VIGVFILSSYAYLPLALAKERVRVVFHRFGIDLGLSSRTLLCFDRRQTASRCHPDGRDSPNWVDRLRRIGGQR
jgi:hypothetical protein